MSDEALRQEVEGLRKKLAANNAHMDAMDTAFAAKKAQVHRISGERETQRQRAEKAETALTAAQSRIKDLEARLSTLPEAGRSFEDGVKAGLGMAADKMCDNGYPWNAEEIRALSTTPAAKKAEPCRNCLKTPCDKTCAYPRKPEPCDICGGDKFRRWGEDRFEPENKTRCWKCAPTPADRKEPSR